ncbi:MAG: TetR/AcrR family transcriptional regulator [Desulfobacterales bacterium]|nr:TetR/AcrR family transcriptional regulator [Desulfobacterales bacterium]
MKGSYMRKYQKADTRKADILESYYQVMIKEGLEGSSIGKIAKHLDIHPSLIIHYFKNKENMTYELVELLTQKYEARHMIDLGDVTDPKERYALLMDIIFSYKWSRTVEPSVHFGFYYLSFRNQKINRRFKTMFKWLRDFLAIELTAYDEAGVIQVSDPVSAADYIVTVMEGMEFQTQFLGDHQKFDQFASLAKKTLKRALENGDF